MSGDYFKVNDECGFSYCSFLILITIIIGGALFVILIILLVKKFHSKNLLEKNYLVTVKAIKVSKKYLTDPTIFEQSSKIKRVSQMHHKLHPMRSYMTVSKYNPNEFLRNQNKNSANEIGVDISAEIEYIGERRYENSSYNSKMQSQNENSFSSYVNNKYSEIYQKYEGSGYKNEDGSKLNLEEVVEKDETEQKILKDSVKEEDAL